MKRHVLIIYFLLTSGIGLQAQYSDTIVYLLKHQKDEPSIDISISFGEKLPDELTMVIPRSAPGTYEIADYIHFVENPNAVNKAREKVSGVRGIGSYFTFSSDEGITSINYSINLQEMEIKSLEAHIASKVRAGYLGVLGYSVFGLIKEYQDFPVKVIIEVNENWPIFSTLSPDIEMKKGREEYVVNSYDLLADAQYLAGPDLEVWTAEDGPIPFFVAMYSEADTADLEYIGEFCLEMLKRLDGYFGFTPMPHYSVHLEYLVPLSTRHSYGFSMEHMNSMTAFSDTSGVISEKNDKRLTVLHHIGHSWIPLRSYGEGYRPFTWEVAPMIETIWLNEGFIWYVAGHEILDSKRIMNFFKRVVKNAPDFISSLSLRELSLLGSSQYGSDFRIGRNLFSRGALMAHDLNLLIQNKSNGDKAFKDVLLTIYNWSEVNNKAFDHDDIPQIIFGGIGIDVSEVWKKWNQPYPLKFSNN